MFSTAEKDRRLNTAAAIMDRYGLGAIYLPGNSVVGPYAFGAQRYLTDSRITFNYKSVVLLKGNRLIAVVNDLMGKINTFQSPFFSDAVINQDHLQGVIDLLKENGINSGTVGTIFEVLPAAWLLRLREELPGIDFIDVSEQLFTARAEKSMEEVETQRICAGIADAGFRALCQTVRPGLFENEIAAEIDRVMQRMGAEENFALITSGKFSIKNNRLPPLHHYSALNRKLEAGDVIAAEISPRYNGYWTQKVRTVCLGEVNKDAEILSDLITRSIEAVKPILRAKTPICEIVRNVREYIEAAGYLFEMPCGHLAGVDLNEGDMTEDNTTPLESGMLLIIHPTVTTNDMDTGIFWGESYQITDDGFEEPMLSGEKLFTAGL